ncbi:DUF5993 family protein [Robbsia betulipollinis]|uniref:DUF5993 family protein n=1 Tax=Robbsia betulipollinis TaxID=2981849 RepID=UPI003D79396F
MFLPFLLAAAMTTYSMLREREWAYVSWGSMLVLILIFFRYHASDVLSLSF